MALFDSLTRPNVERLLRKRNVGRLAKALSHREKEIQQAAIMALGELGEPGIAALRQASLGRPELRLVRAGVLGDLGLHHEAISDIEAYIDAVGGEEKLPFEKIWVLVTRGALKKDAGDALDGLDDINKAIARLDKEAPTPRKSPESVALESIDRVSVGALSSAMDASYAAWEKHRLGLQWKAQAYFERGRCHIALDRTAQARRDLRKAVELEPEWTDRADEVLNTI